MVFSWWSASARGVDLLMLCKEPTIKPSPANANENRHTLRGHEFKKLLGSSFAYFVDLGSRRRNHSSWRP